MTNKTVDAMIYLHKQRGVGVKQQVVAVGFEACGKRFMQLEDGNRVYLTSQEYKKVKQKLSGKQKYYYEVNLKEVEE